MESDNETLEVYIVGFASLPEKIACTLQNGLQLKHFLYMQIVLDIAVEIIQKVSNTTV